jgi:hypothetical protein
MSDCSINKGRETALLKPGLSGGAIKIAGVVMMVFDHLHQMFAAQGAPQWFAWIGRPVLPLFLFMCAEGFAHTRSRKRYLFRLFVCFELMNVASFLLVMLLPNDNIMLMNNVFQTLFMAALYMGLVELFRRGCGEKRPALAAAALVLAALPVAAGLLILTVPFTGPRWAALLYYKCIPNIFTVEGGFSAVIMGLVLYLLRKRRLVQVLAFAAFSLFLLILVLRAGNGPFHGGAQWLMIFAVIPMLLYNGGRGRGNKYFFYIFYPAHIYLLYVIAWFMSL